MRRAPLIARRELIKGIGASILSAPAIIGTARGSALGGFDVGVVSGATPAPAAAWGYRCAYFDGFDSLATVDVNGTNAPGFNAYTTNIWPAANEVFFCDGTLVPASAFTISDSVLTINDASSEATEALIMSVAPNGSGYNGMAFGPGAYFEARIKTGVPGGGGSSGDWPAYWTWPVESLLDTKSSFGEIDIFEQFAGGGALEFHTHAWELSGAACAASAIVNNDYSNGNLTITDDFHTYGFLWVPMAKNGGTGLVYRYFDGQLMDGTGGTVDRRLTYTSSSVTQNGQGTFSDTVLASLDATHLFPIIGTGGNWPVAVDYWGVWQ
jgi:hypothetical protein